jgi:hypothetical protein
MITSMSPSRRRPAAIIAGMASACYPAAEIELPALPAETQANVLLFESVEGLVGVAAPGREIDVSLTGSMEGRLEILAYTYSLEELRIPAGNLRHVFDGRPLPTPLEALAFRVTPDGAEPIEPDLFPTFRIPFAQSPCNGCLSLEGVCDGRCSPPMPVAPIPGAPPQLTPREPRPNCPPGTVAFFGESVCQPIGRPCDGSLPPEPVDVVVGPLDSLDNVLASGAARIAVGPGRYLVTRPIAGAAIFGACTEDTILAPADASLTIVDGALSDVTVEGNILGESVVDLRSVLAEQLHIQSATLHATNVWADDIYLVSTSAVLERAQSASLTCAQSVIEASALIVWNGIAAIGQCEVDVDRAIIQGWLGVSAAGSSTLSIARADIDSVAAFRVATTSLTLRDTILRASLASVSDGKVTIEDSRVSFSTDLDSGLVIQRANMVGARVVFEGGALSGDEGSGIELADSIVANSAEGRPTLSNGVEAGTVVVERSEIEAYRCLVGGDLRVTDTTLRCERAGITDGPFLPGTISASRVAILGGEGIIAASSARLELDDLSVRVDGSGILVEDGPTRPTFQLTRFRIEGGFTAIASSAGSISDGTIIGADRGILSPSAEFSPHVSNVRFMDVGQPFTFLP